MLTMSGHNKVAFSPKGAKIGSWGRGERNPTLFCIKHRCVLYVCGIISWEGSV